MPEKTTTAPLSWLHGVVETYNPTILRYIIDLTKIFKEQRHEKHTHTHHLGHIWGHRLNPSYISWNWTYQDLIDHQIYST